MKMIGLFLFVAISLGSSNGDESKDEFTPLKKNVASIQSILDRFKQPLSDATTKQLKAAFDMRDSRGIETALSEELLLKITINPEGRVRVARGATVPELKKDRPVYALLRIENQSGGSPKLLPVGNYTGESNPFQLELLDAELKGEFVEYRLLKIVCKEVGKRELTISFSAGQGTQDLGFRGEVPVLFDVVK